MPDVLPPITSKPATLKHGRMRLVLALGALLGIGAYGTSASFTDASYVAASFSTGTFDLTVAGSNGIFAQGDPTALSLTQLTTASLYPGGPGAIAELRLSNSGQLPLSVSEFRFSTTNAGGLVNDAGTTSLGQLSRVKVVQFSGGQTCDAALMAGDGSIRPFDGVVSAGLPTLATGATANFCLKVSIATTTDAPLAAHNVDMRIHIRVTAVQV